MINGFFTHETTFQVLNKLDQGLAGFADVFTGGVSTQIRSFFHGETATRNHQGAFFIGGQIVGIGTSFALGTVTPTQLTGTLTLAQRLAQGHTIATTGIGAFQSTRNIAEGRGTVFDALSFAPAIGLIGSKSAPHLQRLENGAFNHFDEASIGLNRLINQASGRDFSSIPVLADGVLERASSIGAKQSFNDINRINQGISGNGRKLTEIFNQPLRSQGAGNPLNENLIGEIPGVTNIDEVVSSSARSSRPGSEESRAVQALRKKVDRANNGKGNEAFKGLPINQETADNIIQESLGNSNQTPIINTGRNRNGQDFVEIFNPSSGRGVRMLKEDGSFDTFVNLN